jgi:hypothetical protein
MQLNNQGQQVLPSGLGIQGGSARSEHKSHEQSGTEASKDMHEVDHGKKDNQAGGCGKRKLTYEALVSHRKEKQERENETRGQKQVTTPNETLTGLIACRCAIVPWRESTSCSVR